MKNLNEILISKVERSNDIKVERVIAYINNKDYHMRCHYIENMWIMNYNFIYSSYI